MFLALFRLATLFASFLMITAPGLADEKPDKPQITSETSDRLKKWLDRFPRADANRDGILTLTEAKKFQTEWKKRKAKRVEKPLPPTGRNLAYGPHERHRLDFWQAEDAKKSSPLLVYIHGGGFVAGSKEKIRAELVQEALNRGYAVASINYRFVTDVMFPSPQEDGARAIQFLKSKAEEWNLDPERFAVFGGSAGAGISMWLAYHDDLADPNAEDAILRESSRVAAVGSLAGQSSYDPFVIRDWIGGQAHLHPSIFLCYNVLSLQQLQAPKFQQLYDEVSAIKHVSEDDPPTFLFYAEADEPLPPNPRPGQGIHHPIFAHKLVEKLKAAGIDYEYRHASTDGREWILPMLDFLDEHLGVNEPEEKTETAEKD